MLRRIIEKNKKALSLSLEIENLFKNLKSSCDEIDAYVDKIDSKYSVLIDNYKKKVNTLELHVSDKAAKDLVVQDDFSSNKYVQSNSGFEFLSEKTAFKLSPKNTEKINNIMKYESNFGTTGTLTFVFNKPTAINKLKCSFNNSLTGFSLPSKIKYLYNGVEYELIENFERYFDRKNQAENIYFFYPKKVDSVKFYFETSLENITVNDIAFYLEEFEDSGEIFFNYPVSTSASSLLLKLNYFDEFDSLEFFIYKNNLFQKLVLTNKMAYLENDGNDILIKAVFNTKNMKLKADKAIVSSEGVVVSPGSDDLICFDLCNEFESVDSSKDIKFTTNFSLMSALNETRAGSIELVDDVPTFKDSQILFLSSSESISDALKFRLTDLDNINHIALYKKELIIFDQTNKKVYFPKIFNMENYLLRVSFTKQTLEEISSTNHYSPYIFDLTISE